jgi:hypothetical protein
VIGIGDADVWILRRAELDWHPVSHLLVADAAEDPAAAVAACRSFLDDPTADLPAGARAVPIIDLLDDEVDIGPLRHVARAAERVNGVNFAQVETALRPLLSRLPSEMPKLAEASWAPHAATTTLAELVRTGIVTVHQAPLKTVVDDGPELVLMARDVRRGRPPSGRAAWAPGMVRIEPDDVVVAMSSRDFGVRVMPEGDALLGPQLVLFRVDSDRLDPYFLAGFLQAGRLAAIAGPTTSSRSDIHRTVLPRLPLADQRAYGAAFRQLMKFDDDIREATERAAELVRLGFGGLAGGGLGPPAGKS